VTPRARRRLGALVAPLVAGLLLVACGGGGGHGGESYKEPKGPAAETIEVSAKNFSFTPDTITTKPGIVELELTSTGGLHDLVFDDDAVPGFHLEAKTGDTDAKKVDLKPGKYDFYCTLPGHRQAGMEGTITVK
jgi:plastocyanin